ncbi:alkylphosphocholine resistance protein lem3 [Saitoella coloradoensis]
MSDTDERSVNVGKKEKSRKPGNTAFRQQRLKAWQPILTPKTVLPIFFAIGIIFAPIGGLLLYASRVVSEVMIDYTHCITSAENGTFSPIPSNYLSASFDKSKLQAKWSISTNTSVNPYPGSNGTVCNIQFHLPEKFGAPWFLYYHLTNFYQNHRRYIQSVDIEQLSGHARTASDVDSTDSCSPLAKDGDLPYYPCGLIANSQFNDTFSDLIAINPPSGAAEIVVLSKNNIAWSSDKDLYKNTSYTPETCLPPPNWVGRYGTTYSASDLYSIHEDEELMVWMRTAGLPDFSKLARRNDTYSLPAGTYNLSIGLNFPVTEYDGTKSILLSTRSVIGGRNDFLGIAYLVVAGLCIILGALFTARHLIKPRKLGDHRYLSWSQ